jgi:branched-chain amino acid aminotransferase
MSGKIWLNGRLVSEKQAKVSVLDRGFLYGDGVYETVRVYGGKIFRAENHWRRLDRSLKGLRMKAPWTHAQLTRACEAVIRANRLQECLVRVTISRGVGEIGYDPRTCGKPTIAVLSSHIRKGLVDLWTNGVEAAIVSVRRNSLKSLSPAVKHTNCLNGILAKMESIDAGAFEGVFLNPEGHLAEGTISNIFIVKNGVAKTPSLDCGLLDGVTRAAILESAKAARIPVKETHIKPAEVYAADEVFLTSTTMEAMPVVRVNGRKIGGGKPGPVTRRLHKSFRALLERELKIRFPVLPFLPR